MKYTLTQRLISARPDDHPANTAFVERTMVAVQAASATETFSESLRTMDTTKKETFFMKLRSLPKPALIALAITLILGVSGTVYAAYYITQQAEPTPHQSAVDPTKDWTPYTSPAGKFSLRYPTSWVQPTDKERCEATAFDRSLSIGPDAQSVVRCGTDNGLGQVYIQSVEGNKVADYKLATEYNQIDSKPVKVSGVTGQRDSATVTKTAPG